MKKYRDKKTWGNFLVLTLVIFNFYGCVAVPKKGQLRSFTIAGATYFSLVSLCELKNIKWDYDPLTRTAGLQKDAHRINFQSGGRIIFVDGSPRKLNEPVDIYRGMLVVSGQFRRIIEDLFAEYAPQSNAVNFSKIKKVIIDPGHGGKDPGAPGRNGLNEKDIVLDIAKRLSGLLRKYGVETVLTRSTDKFIPLEQRAALTENSQADLFISIHANANPARSLNGFEAYYISPAVSDYKRAISSAKKVSLSLEDAVLNSPNLNLKAILWDMTYNYNRGESIQLARDICKSVGHSVDTRIIGVKNANYCVLRGACIPAVLIEVGFLSNIQEEQFLNEPNYRQKIAEGIKTGIYDYASQTYCSGIKQKSCNLAKAKEGSK